jgi:hypothetical protein
VSAGNPVSSLDPFGVQAQTGYVSQTPPSATVPGVIPGVGRSSGPNLLGGSTSLVSMRNPLTWFAIFAAATFGLIGFSSTARVGKARGKVSLGKE